MTHPSMSDRLLDVLDAYRAAAPRPDAEALAEWVRRYPEYERELTEFTVSWSLSETLPPSPELADISREELLARGQSVVGRILSAQGVSRLTDALPSDPTQPAQHEAPTDAKHTIE